MSVDGFPGDVLIFLDVIMYHFVCLMIFFNVLLCWSFGFDNGLGYGPTNRPRATCKSWYPNQETCSIQMVYKPTYKSQ